MATDLYEILGVPGDASPDDIKRAYRQLARELHPDVNGSSDAEERFKLVAGAYEILSDPEKRQRYDTFGQTSGTAGVPFTDVQDIFDLFFGGAGFGVGTRTRRGPRRSRVQRGEDMRAFVSLSFEEAAFGVRRDIEVQRLVGCERCGGNGAEPGTTPIPCRRCGGTGELQEVRRSIFGTIMTAAPCITCAGTGEEIPDRCEACFGEGRVARSETVALDVPAGVANGVELRIPGAGSGGRAGGTAGDLYVALSVEPSASFDRRGQDLFGVLDVPYTLAALGGEVVVPTLDGEERIHIDAGTESGEVIRLKGEGVPNLHRRGRGDLYVTVHVTIPGDVSASERELLERLADLRGERSSKKDPRQGTLRPHEPLR